MIRQNRRMTATAIEIAIEDKIVGECQLGSYKIL